MAARACRGETTLALLLAFAFTAVIVGILAVTRLFGTRTVACLTVLYGVLSVAALLLLDTGSAPGANIAGSLVALTVLAGGHVAARVRRERRQAAAARQRRDVRAAAG